MALALVASAIVLAQLFVPTSMLSAMRRVEVARLNADSPHHRPGAATWNQVWSSYVRAARKLPEWNRHLAIQGLLEAVVKVDRRVPDAALSDHVVQQFLASAGENLLVRLACATLIDMRADSTQPARSNPSAPFSAMRRIVNGNGPWRRCTLYNDTFTDRLRTDVKRYVRRGGLASGVARSIVQYPIDDHFAALPIVQRRLKALADRLRSEGDAESADECSQWMGRCLLGLIDSERDSGTRLLCVELLGRCVDPASDAARELRALKADFHAHADAAPIDVAGMMRHPALDATAYRWAYRSLLAVCILVLVACGAALACVIGCGGAVIARRRGPPDEAGETTSRRSRPVRWALGLVPPVAGVVLVLLSFPDRGLPSQTWAIVIVAATLFLGQFASVGIASLFETPRRPGLARRIVSVSIPILVMLVYFIPPADVAATIGTIQPSVGTALGLAAAVVLFGIAAVVLSPASSRTICAMAALVWLTSATAGLVAGQVHRLADKRYQASVVRGLDDELAARLGDDWQDEYLGAARAAFGADRP